MSMANHICWNYGGRIGTKNRRLTPETVTTLKGERCCEVESAMVVIERRMEIERNQKEKDDRIDGREN